MEVRVTVTDPKAYTHPFTVTLNEYLEPAGELMDFVCLENDSSGPPVPREVALSTSNLQLPTPKVSAVLRSSLRRNGAPWKLEGGRWKFLFQELPTPNVDPRIAAHRVL
jgi:hypothetical protein